jgi:hypothetical protein
MRRSLPALLLIGSMTVSCAGSTSGSLSPRPASDALPAAAAADDAAARATVLTFLEAYAAAPTAGMKPLVSVLDPSLKPWARMVRLQLAQFPGTQTGNVTLTSVGAPVPVDLGAQTGSVQAVAVHSEVTFEATPDTGKPSTYTRLFDGPVVVSRVAPGTWVVQDFVRDSDMLSSVFHAFEPPIDERSGPSVSVALQSMYAGSTGRWQFDVVVRVGGNTLATLQSASLVDSSGANASADVTVPPELERVSGGRRAEGVVAFDPPSSTRGLTLRLVFAGPRGAGPVVFPLPAPSGNGPGSSPSSAPGAA